MTTWVVSAQRSQAAVYAHSGRGQGLHLLRELSSPGGRLRDAEINTDRSGRSHEGLGTTGHGFEPPRTAHEHNAERFASEIAQVLAEGRHAHRYTQLILVAEPHMLGILRVALDETTARSVIGSLAKEYRSEQRDLLEEALAREFVL